MVFMDCCKVPQRPYKAYEIEPRKSVNRAIYFHLKKCAKCGSERIKVFEYDEQGKIINGKGRSIKSKRKRERFLSVVKIIRELDVEMVGTERMPQKLDFIAGEYTLRESKGIKPMYY